eukprot:jgi/Picsp_1/2361/NSC_05824-R1_programmed cell death protein 6-interacting protein
MEATICSPQSSRSYQRTSICVKTGVSVQALLVAIRCKVTEPVRFRAEARDCAEHEYGVERGRRKSDSSCLERLDELRRKATTVPVETVSKHGLKQYMVHYYEKLNELEKAFPIFSKEMNVCFSWHDAFKSDRVCAMDDIHLEKAAILFNTASVCSQLAYEQEKGTVNGLKQAGKLFQESSGVFSFLRQEMLTARPLSQTETFDMCPLCLEMLEITMMAQSQECALGMAFLQGKSDVTLAKLAKAVCNLYETVLETLSTKELEQYFDKSWRQLFTVKQLIYDALASQHYAAYVRGIEYVDIDTRVRNEIAYLKHAKDTLSRAKRKCNKTKSSAKEAVNERYGIIENLLREKMDDNKKVYMQFNIPLRSELEQIKPAVVVNSKVPDYLLQPTATSSMNSHSGYQKEYSSITLLICDEIEKSSSRLWNYLTCAIAWEELRVFCEGYVKSLFPTSNVFNAFMMVIVCYGLMFIRETVR